MHVVWRSFVRILPPAAKKYILATDRPTGDRRPMTDDRPTTSHLGKFQMAIYPRGVVRSTSCLVLRGVFGVGGSNGASSGYAKSKMAAQPPSWKIQMAISPRRIIRFTPCLVLGRGFRDGGSNGANSGLTELNRYVGENNARGVIRLVTILKYFLSFSILLLQRWCQQNRRQQLQWSQRQLCFDPF